MQREDVIQLAREAGCGFSEGSKYLTFTESELERFAAAVEQRTLERAAQKCERISLELAEVKEPPAHLMAAAIRALKDGT